MLKGFLTLIFLSSVVFSLNATFDSSLDQNGQSVHLLRTYFAPSDSKSLIFEIFGQIEDIEVLDGSGSKVEFNQSYSNGWSKIQATAPFNYLEASFVSASQTSKNSSVWSYGSLVRFNSFLDYFDATLILPKNAQILSTNGGVSLRDSLVLSWSASSVSAISTINMKETHQISSFESKLDILPYAFGLFILVLLSILVFYFKSNKSPSVNFLSQKESISTPINPIPQTSSLEKLENNSVYKTLDEVDKQLVREIYLKGGSTTQAQLNLNTQIPKATLSRRIASLESKGILQKNQKGIRNLISLTDLISS